MDIRSIVKTRVDLSILLSLLLSKEQILLFRNQHARAFVNYNKSKNIVGKALPDESIDRLREDLDLVQQPKTGFQATFESIKGFKVETDLDRKLILGLWKNWKED